MIHGLYNVKLTNIHFHYFMTIRFFSKKKKSTQT
jgi:hypothetical protein